MIWWANAIMIAAATIIPSLVLIVFAFLDEPAIWQQADLTYFRCVKTSICRLCDVS